MSDKNLSRRALLATGAAALTLAAPGIVRAQTLRDYEPETAVQTARRNVMGFRNHDWRDHFDNLRRGAILCDMDSRALYFWSADGRTELVYPTSVPMTDDFARRGVTHITMLRVNPTWIPTPNMRARDPSLPPVVHPGPDNPLGTRAMNLSWEFYRIHGIDNPAKIGRRASNGCIGLLNPHVEYLFEQVQIGTQVRLI